MAFSEHELWTIFHGFFFGGLIVLSFAGIADGLWNLKPGTLTEHGLGRCLRRVKLGITVMTVASWAAVLLGTFRIYAWYREDAPWSPRSRLLADPTKSTFHTFGMEWKEHIAWMVPILITTAAFIVFHYREDLASRKQIRVTTFWLVFLGFITALTTGLLGAFINKVAPFL